MPTKKRFSINVDLASGIRNTIESVTNNEGQLHYDMMPLDLIETDPKNPRQLSVNKSILRNLAGTRLTPTQQRELDALQELATSIQRVGIRNAIEVYKEGAIYRIISGERRYLASVLINLATVPVRISPKPNDFNLRYTQWIENINRQDLSLWEKYNNLVSIKNAYEKDNDKLTEKSLQTLIGTSSIQTYRYFCLLNADVNIVELIKSGKVTNLKVVQELTAMKDKGGLQQLLNWINSTGNDMTSLSNMKSMVSKKRPKVASINLGKISNSKTARYIVDRLLDDDYLAQYQHHFKNVDWSTPKTASQAFKKLFKLLESELIKLETA